MDWCEFFGFRFDPFFDKPLESKTEMEKWLIVEKKMAEEVTPLIRQMSQVPFLSLVVGDRGVGKSTFMYYSMKLAKESSYLPVYVGLDHIGLEISKRPTYEITETVMYEFGARLLDAILSLQTSFFSDNKTLLLNLGRYLGLEYQDSEGFIPSGKPYRLDFFELKRYTLAILNLMKKARIPVLLAIDNLDKVTKLKILRGFFTAPFAQTFFDDLKKGGVSILLAMAPQFARYKQRDFSLKYLTQEIHVSPISPPQTVELLTKRIRYSNDPPPRNPFEKEALISIGLVKKGIIRDILTEVRNLCLRAYSQKLLNITKEFVSSGIVSFDESRAFYEIVEQDEKNAEHIFELCKLATNPDVDFEQVISITKKIMMGKRITASDELFSILIDSSIIRLSTGEKYVLSEPIRGLLEAITKSGWNVDQFFEYLSAKDSVQVIVEGIPGINAKAGIDLFGPIPSVLKPTVDVIIGNMRQTIQTRELHQEANSELRESKKIFDHIGRITWDDIDNVSTYKKIYAALRYFLSAFSKLYVSCATSRTIRLKSWRVTDLVENAIHHFQEEFGVSFKSFHRFQRLRANMNGLLHGGFAPSHSDIKDAFEDFQKILVEFTRVWQRISYKFSRLEVADPQHSTTLKEVSKLAVSMGYSIERPEYTRFKIDGDKYYKLGFLKFPLDQAHVDTVREKRLRNRLNQVQSDFLISCVNPDSRRKASVKEILAFIHRCNDLVDIIDKESSNQPIGWPRYLLFYVSSSGFEPGIQEALRSTIRSPRSKVHTLDYARLNLLKRQFTPTKTLPKETVHEYELDGLRKKDLEQLLRFRLYTARLIREKFEKTTTILIADMKGFTERTMRDKFESAEAVQEMSDILEKNVRTYQGVGANTEGDSFIATFAKPELAALAALESIGELERYNQEVKEDKRIFVRIGICTGDVLLKMGRPFVGNAVNIAARIMKNAEPNKVVITEDTYKQISFHRNFDFNPIGTKKFKGIEEPLTIYEVRARAEPT